MSLTHKGHHGKLRVPIETPDDKEIFVGYKIKDGGSEPTEAWLVPPSNTYVWEDDPKVIKKYAPMLIELLHERWVSQGKKPSFIEQKGKMVLAALMEFTKNVKVTPVRIKIDRSINPICGYLLDVCEYKQNHIHHTGSGFIELEPAPEDKLPEDSVYVNTITEELIDLIVERKIGLVAGSRLNIITELQTWDDEQPSAPTMDELQELDKTQLIIKAVQLDVPFNAGMTTEELTLAIMAHAGATTNITIGNDPIIAGDKITVTSADNEPDGSASIDPNTNTKSPQ